MRSEAERVRLFLGEHVDERADESLPHGEVCVRSVRSPDKDTPNEDAAAVIQVGDDSLVLAVADGVGSTSGARDASNATVRTLSRVLEAVPRDEPQLRPAILDAVEADLAAGGLDALTERAGRWTPRGDLAWFRRLELAAALNRLRTLRVSPGAS